MPASWPGPGLIGLAAQAIGLPAALALVALLLLAVPAGAVYRRRGPGPVSGGGAGRTFEEPAPVISLTHLQRLEAEGIHIIREVVAETERPVMLYSVGKDSAVMLHLARKAFFPGPPPFPLLHVDTTWKFQDMYRLRDRVGAESGMRAAGAPQPRGDGARHQPVRPRRGCTPTCGRPRG